MGVPQWMINSGAIWSGPIAFPLFTIFTAAFIFAAVKASVDRPMVSHVLMLAISALISLLLCLSMLQWQPFLINLEAMALSITGQSRVFFTQLVRQLKVCQTVSLNGFFFR